jgi:predicted lipoprotein with Yx(FWY)xxD motif
MTPCRTPASHGVVISARALPGIGSVLVNRSGKTLYSPPQGAHGKILCTGGRLSFWLPLSVDAGATLHAPTGITGMLGTIHRPDGLTQLTYNGKPLYTFRLDYAPGQAHGNNLTDHSAVPPSPGTPSPRAGPQPGPASRARPVVIPTRAARGY